MKIVVNPEKYQLLSEEGKKYFDAGLGNFCVFLNDYIHQVDGIEFEAGIDFYFEVDSDFSIDNCLSYDRIKIRKGCFCASIGLIRIAEKTEDLTEESDTNNDIDSEYSLDNEEEVHSDGSKKTKRKRKTQ